MDPHALPGPPAARPEIILIAAMAANRVIGQGNAIPWHVPGEQQHFKRITMGHTLIMGRKTHESIGRVLPGRRTIVITRQRDYQAPGCLVAHDLATALDAAMDDSQVFIAGGAEIFRQGLRYADAIYLSILHREVAGGVFFPEFSPADFPLVAQEVIDEGEPYTFAIYRRKQG
jgi:dihydrofolate reductase